LRLSVIVPAHQASLQLPLSLEALQKSDLPRDAWELVVVDDASTDDTYVVAARFADTVVRLPGNPHGPAYARNRGVEAARGEVVVFVDADVCVHTDTLRLFADLFDRHPDVTAIFGSYDANPAAPGVVSGFRNLLHHHVHQRDAGEAETFWAGCGAVRASAFRAVGMFDEWHYHRPQIEDIELGRRLRLHGHRILLRPEIQGTHLKRWTLRDIMSTDFRHRGVPWTRLLLQERPTGAARRTLNLRLSEKTATAFAGVGWLALFTALIMRATWPLWALLPIVLGIALLNRSFYWFLLRARGIRFALGVLPLHVLYYLINVVSVLFGWLLHILLGEPHAPVTVTAEAGMDLKTWPPRPARPDGGVWNPVGQPAHGKQRT
jgi:glycosyltransferase involved in cell wall biosynthesis